MTTTLVIGSDPMRLTVKLTAGSALRHELVLADPQVWEVAPALVFGAGDGVASWTSVIDEGTALFEATPAQVDAVLATGELRARVVLGDVVIAVGRVRRA